MAFSSAGNESRGNAIAGLIFALASVSANALAGVPASVPTYF